MVVEGSESGLVGNPTGGSGCSTKPEVLELGKEAVSREVQLLYKSALPRKILIVDMTDL